MTSMSHSKETLKKQTTWEGIRRNKEQTQSLEAKCMTCKNSPAKPQQFWSHIRKKLGSRFQKRMNICTSQTNQEEEMLPSFFYETNFDLQPTLEHNKKGKLQIPVAGQNA